MINPTMCTTEGLNVDKLELRYKMFDLIRLDEIYENNFMFAFTDILMYESECLGLTSVKPIFYHVHN